MFVRTVIGIVGALIVVGGIGGVFGGCVLLQTYRAGGGSMFLTGIAAIVVGWLIVRASESKPARNAPRR